MPTINEIWIKPVIQYTKTSVIFTMFITAVLTQNILGFVLYFIGYQLASLARFGVYKIVTPETEQATPLTYNVFDYLDIVTFISNNKIPQIIYLPLYTISYTLAFIVYTFRIARISTPQIILGTMFLVFLICYLLTIYMFISPFKMLPYVEILFGFGIGLMVNYLISMISTSALFFYKSTPRRKRLVCKPI